MVSVCFYFQVHQPYRVKRYSIFSIGNDHDYFSDHAEDRLNNKKILHKVAQKGYLKTNKVLLDLLKKHPEFKISFSFSGVVLEQFSKYAPEVLQSFKDLVDTGRAEVLGETYYHSLAFLYSREEFREQVAMHRALVEKLFGVKPQVFRNTELIYNNEIAKEVHKLGYKGIIAEGADHVLGWRSPNFLYHPPHLPEMKLLLKNYRLSDDIAFRFSNRDWKEWPLTAPKFAQWVAAVNGCGDVVNLFMDYETFGEHQWEDTGIYDFLSHLPSEILRHPDNSFVTPSEAVAQYPVRGDVDVPFYVSWADVERDLSAWLSNQMQHAAIQKLYGLRDDVMSTEDAALIESWRKLQTSDHFYYMCTKWFSDGDVHKYFNPYETPYDAFINYMNVLQDLQLRIKNVTNPTTKVVESNVYKS